MPRSFQEQARPLMKDADLQFRKEAAVIDDPPAGTAASSESPASEDTSPELRLLLEDVARYRRFRRNLYSHLKPGDPFLETIRVVRGQPPEPMPAKEQTGAQGPPPPAPLGRARPRPAQDGSDLPRKQIGLNAVKAFQYEEHKDTDPTTQDVSKYSTAKAQFEDCRSLGAVLLRQHGVRDLLWGMLAEHKPIPTSSQLGGLIDSRNNRRRYGKLLAEACNSGRKLIFTFLTLGGGAQPLDEGDAEDPLGEMKNVLGLSWSADHLGRSEGGYDFSYIAVDPSDHAAVTAADAWFTKTLDIRSGYKRYYLGLIAEQVALLLMNAVVAAQPDCPGLALRDVVAGIEIFNEVDNRNHFYTSGGERDRVVQATYWAKAYLACAEKLHTGLGGEVPILLPGLSSYGIHSTENGWSQKCFFLKEFLKNIYRDAKTLRFAYAQGMDYHWYHRNPDKQLHIGYLLAEVGEIRALLDQYISPEAEITVLESGVSLRDDFQPEIVRKVGGSLVSSILEPELFQSNEVWRRVGGALASGAVAAGWHSWMSSTDSGFTLMGLREDEQATSAPASDAKQRWSWFSFQRLAERLGNVHWGKMIRPIINTRSKLEEATPEDYLVVFEFKLSGSPRTTQPYAYLAFYDPTGPANGAYISVYCEQGGPNATLVATRSRRLSNLNFGIRSLPTSPARFDPDSTFTIPATAQIFKEDSPLLILSDLRLTWGFISAFDGVPS